MSLLSIPFPEMTDNVASCRNLSWIEAYPFFKALLTDVFALYCASWSTIDPSQFPLLKKNLPKCSWELSIDQIFLE